MTFHRRKVGCMVQDKASLEKEVTGGWENYLLVVVHCHINSNLDFSHVVKPLLLISYRANNFTGK